MLSHSLLPSLKAANRSVIKMRRGFFQRSGASCTSLMPSPPSSHRTHTQYCFREVGLSEPMFRPLAFAATVYTLEVTIMQATVFTWRKNA